MGELNRDDEEPFFQIYAEIDQAARLLNVGSSLRHLNFRHSASGPIPACALEVVHVSYWRERDHRLSPMVGILKLNLLRDSQRIVYLDAEVSDRAFELRVTEQNLDRA